MFLKIGAVRNFEIFRPVTLLKRDFNTGAMQVCLSMCDLFVTAMHHEMLVMKLGSFDCNSLVIR